MESYQNKVLRMLEETAGVVKTRLKVRGYTTAVHYRYANSGRIVAMNPLDLSTGATVDFDFQDNVVHASLNEDTQPGCPKIGPRSDTIFHWTPGDDSGEVARLCAALSAALEAKSKAPQ